MRFLIQVNVGHVRSAEMVPSEVHKMCSLAGLIKGLVAEMREE
jgi:hypothetical protein